MKIKPMLTWQDVSLMLQAAQTEAQAHQWAVAIAVLDDGGHLLGAMRLDGATPANMQIALQKAESSALSRRSTQIWEERIAAGRLSMLKMPVLPVQGGLPVMIDGLCVGAVGVSGVQSHEDEQIAQAAINALLAHVNP